MSKLLILAVVALLALFYYSDRTPDDLISGRAKVVDGDSLNFSNQRIRLFGIDAPEGKQMCIDTTGADYLCGRVAKIALSDFLGGQLIECQQIDRDQYDRIVARCFLDDQDIASWMVVNGHALAYREFSDDYIDEEDVARTMKRGMWRGGFDPPWEWRRR